MGAASEWGYAVPLSDQEGTCNLKLESNSRVKHSIWSVNPPEVQNTEKTELVGTGEALIPLPVLDQLGDTEESADGDQMVPSITGTHRIGGCDVEV